jgi:hypothetical protein
VLAMIATFQFTAAFDHWVFLNFLSGRGSTMKRF